jgi:hypothetical protein
MSMMETIGAMLPEELRAEFESLRIESQELTKKGSQLSELETGRAKAIIQRMDEIINSQPGLWALAKQREGKLHLLREQMHDGTED